MPLIMRRLRWSPETHPATNNLPAAYASYGPGTAQVGFSRNRGVTDRQTRAVTGGASKARCSESYLMSWCSRAHFSASFSSVRASWICCIALTL